MNPEMSDAEQDLRTSLKTELQNTTFPLDNPMEFSAGLSNGNNTILSMGDSAIRASEIGVGLSSEMSYPYRSTSSFVADVVEILKEQDRL